MNEYEIEDIGEYEEYGEWFVVGKDIYIQYNSPNPIYSTPGNKEEMREIAERISKLLSGSKGGRE